MNKVMCSHLLKAYGTTKAVWVGILLTAASHFILKILVPIAATMWIVSITSGTDRLISGIATIAALFVVSISFAYIGDYIFVRYTDARYEVLVSEFYDNLMGKDISFFRAHRTGTLNSLFRDYMDGTINIFRLMRTGVFPLLISSLAPLFVLCYFDWRVAAVFCCTMGLRCYLSYIFTPRIESARDEALSVYRELSGKMSDQIAHFPIVRASANYEINRSKITSLASDEGRLFWESHSTAMLSDCLQSVLTAACFVSTFVVISISTLAGTISLEVSILSVFFIIQGMQAASTTGDLVQSFIKRRGQVRSALRSLESDTTS